MTTPLSEKQKERLKILEPKLDCAVRNRNYAAAKNLVVDIQELLRPTGHYVRLSQSKNKLYELSIEQGDYNFAISGLMSNRTILKSNTRIHLETTALLAICYTRMQEIESAKPYIKEVLTNQNVIKSERTRQIFHSEIIERFNEEAALATLKSDVKPIYNEDEIENEVVKICQNLNDQEIYAQIGESSPKSTKDLIFLVYNYTTVPLKFRKVL